MKYLLDTCTLLWFFKGLDELSENARDIIENDKIRKYVSAASLWEFAISCSLGRFQVSIGFAKFRANIESNGFDILPISVPYLEQLIPLPFHHRDPFDRLLVATAQTEDMTIVTCDENIRKYDVRVVW